MNRPVFLHRFKKYKKILTLSLLLTLCVTIGFKKCRAFNQNMTEINAISKFMKGFLHNEKNSRLDLMNYPFDCNVNIGWGKFSTTPTLPLEYTLTTEYNDDTTLLKGNEMMSIEDKIKQTSSIYFLFLKYLNKKGFISPVLPFSWSDWKDSSMLNNINQEQLYQQIQDLIHDRPYDKPSTPLAKKIEGNTQVFYNKGAEVVNMVMVDGYEQNIEFKVQPADDHRKSAIFESHGLFDLEKFKQATLDLVQTNNIKEFEELSQLNLKMPLRTPKFDRRQNKKYVLSSKDKNESKVSLIQLFKKDFEISFKKPVEERTQSNEISRFGAYLENKVYEGYQWINSNFEALEHKKFFHEVLVYRKGSRRDIDRAGGHYDWRFFNGLLTKGDLHLRLHHMVRTFQAFAHNEGVHYWLAHGNLLGWRWIGSNFPWDLDMDLQLPIIHLEYLAANFNQSLIIEDPHDGTGRYYLEINPLFAQVDHGTGKNVIDGRFIDIDTGVFLDLTGVAYKMGHKRKMVLGDKNKHFYEDLDTLSPLRQTIFEGSISYVPNEVDRVLVQEYPGGLAYSDWTGYQYIPKLKGWIKKTCVVNNKVSSNPSLCDGFELTQLKAMTAIWNNHQIEEQIVCANFYGHDSKYCNRMKRHNKAGNNVVHADLSSEPVKNLPNDISLDELSQYKTPSWAKEEPTSDYLKRLVVPALPYVEEK